MMRSGSTPALVLVLVALLFLGHALTFDVRQNKVGYFSDEATYHAMALSLAYDADIRYEQHDLERIFELEYTAGPSGIFLKKEPQTGRIYYAKAFIYPLVAAPFVRLFSDNGFFVLHALLLAGLFAAGYAYLRRALSGPVAALYTITYLMASVALLYYFWITPEWFNLSLVFFATFLWLYKLPPAGWAAGARESETRKNSVHSDGGRRSDVGRAEGDAGLTRARQREVADGTDGWAPVGLLAADWTDFAAAALYGIAAYSKPPNLIFVVPLIVWTAWRGQWRRAAVVVLVTIVALAVLFGATWAATGDWNFQGGDRRTFYGPYPFEPRAGSWETIGSPMVTEAGDVWLPSLGTMLLNFVYVFVGRNAGLLVYMFPAVLAVFLFLRSPGRTLRGPHTLLIAAAVVQALFFLLVISNNWIGGGGAVGNRYFLGLYPVLFFVIPWGARPAGAVLAWTIAALFLAQILLNPFTSSHSPALHTKSYPLKLFPTELTLLNNLPFNTNPHARRIPLTEDPEFFLYFIDNNTYLRETEAEGFWVKGERKAEVVLRSMRPVETLVLSFQNGPEHNRVRARVAGDSYDQTLEPREEATWRAEPSRSTAYEGTYLYRFTVESESGFLPRFSEGRNDDLRYLGVLVRPTVEMEASGSE
jgi:hypothetical protein